MDALSVPVNLKDHSYAISVAPGLLRDAGRLARALSPATKAAIITDTEVGPRFAGVLRDSLARAGFETIDAMIPAGEEHKTLTDLLPVFDRLLSARMDRGTL